MKRFGLAVSIFVLGVLVWCVFDSTLVATLSYEATG
jgi:hypothetical protein